MSDFLEKKKQESEVISVQNTVEENITTPYNQVLDDARQMQTEDQGERMMTEEEKLQTEEKRIREILGKRLEGKSDEEQQKLIERYREKNKERLQIHEKKKRAKEERRAHIEKLKKEKEQAEKNAERERTEMRLSVLRGAAASVISVKFSLDTIIESGFKSKFSSKVSDKARLKKQNNKRSRLFAKKQNAKALANITEKVREAAFEKLKKSLGNNYDKDSDDQYDLAAFATGEESKLFTKIAGDLESGENQINAIDQLWTILNRTDYKGSRLDNDKVLAEKASDFERLGMQIASFESLANKYGYFDSLDDRTRKVMESKLDEMRQIYSYYEARRDVITDPLYMSHYNEELSMDFTSASTDEQIALAKKLTKSYLACKNVMMSSNQATYFMDMHREPRFKMDEEAEKYMGELGKVLSDTGYKNYMAARYSNEKMKHHANSALGMMLIDRNENHALEMGGYANVLSGKAYSKENKYVSKYNKKSITEKYSTVGKMSRTIKQGAEADQESLINSIEHITNLLDGFDTSIYKEFDSPRNFLTNIGTKQRMMAVLAKQARKMIDDFENNNVEKSEEFDLMRMGENNDYESLKQRLDKIIDLGYVYDRASEFYGSPIVLDYDSDELLKLIQSDKRLVPYLNNNQKMLKKYGQAWKDHVANAVVVADYLKNHKKTK